MAKLWERDWNGEDGAAEIPIPFGGFQILPFLCCRQPPPTAPPLRFFSELIQSIRPYCHCFPASPPFWYFLLEVFFSYCSGSKKKIFWKVDLDRDVWFFFLFSFSFSVLIGVNLFALKSNFQMIQRLNPKINWALIGRFSCLNLPWIV